jgi:hypothetical protein
MLLVVIALFFAPPIAADLTRPTTHFADVTLRWDRGALTVVKVTRTELPEAKALRRWRGRFEARALDGKKTLDYVRFDFPLLAAAEAGDEMTAEATAFGRKLRSGVTATTIVRLPLPDGVTAASIYDSETRRTLPITLPEAPPGSPPAAAGSTRK